MLTKTFFVCLFVFQQLDNVPPLFCCSSKLHFSTNSSDTKHHKTPEPRAALPQMIVKIPWTGCTACFWPRCRSKKWANGWNHTKQRQRANTSTLKTHYVSYTALMLAPCGEHSVSGKGVIFHSGLPGPEPADLTVTKSANWSHTGRLTTAFLCRTCQIHQMFQCICSLSAYMSAQCANVWMCRRQEVKREATLWTSQCESEKQVSLHSLTGVISLIQSHLTVGNDHLIWLHDGLF